MGDNLMKERFKENKWMFAGGVVIVVAILTPLILILVRNHLDKKTFEALGPVGDFFGGTTVGLLTLASMLFVIASISMQRKQLDMQQVELKTQREELAKTREEFELTNKTLTKQQFESTFFNMINLHHNLLKDLEGRREYFNENYESLRGEYRSVVENHWKEQLNMLKDRKPDQFKKLLLTMYINNRKVSYLKNSLNDYENLDFGDNKLMKKIKSDIENNFEDSFSKKKLKVEFAATSIDHRFSESIRDLNILNYFSNKNSYRIVVYGNNESHYRISNVEFFESFQEEELVNFLKQIRRKTLLKPSHLKRIAYEKLYKEREEEIGHYYRNLYRIVRFIQDEIFSTDEEENKKEKKKYRGILRAQLSSMELLMLFYNVVYSEKGEKFKSIIKGTNFFDDHLIESKFLWANDKVELDALK